MNSIITPILSSGRRLAIGCSAQIVRVDFIKSPHDQPLRDQYIWDFSAERRMTPKWSIYVEAFGNSRPAVLADSTVAGALATEYRFSNHINACVSVGYDTDQLLVVRPGFNIEF